MSTTLFEHLAYSYVWNAANSSHIVTEIFFTDGGNHLPMNSKHDLKKVLECIATTQRNGLK